MNAYMFVVLLAVVSCLADRPINVPDPNLPLAFKLLVGQNREKRFVFPILENILGTAGEIVTSVGTGLIGAKAGIQQGGLAARILNNGGSLTIVPNQPAPPYFDPNYAYNAWYYDPNNPYGYYG